ncbi:MAG: type II toxin-antitoxin system HicB family antitoxin [bacterium]
MMDKAITEYLVVFEQTPNNWGAYSPDVPGCVATGKTRDETLARFREALEFHFDGLRRQGLPVPLPVSSAGYVVIETPDH